MHENLVGSANANPCMKHVVEDKWRLFLSKCKWAHLTMKSSVLNDDIYRHCLNVSLLNFFTFTLSVIPSSILCSSYYLLSISTGSALSLIQPYLFRTQMLSVIPPCDNTDNICLFDLARSKVIVLTPFQGILLPFKLFHNNSL